MLDQSVFFQRFAITLSYQEIKLSLNASILSIVDVIWLLQHKNKVIAQAIITLVLLRILH